MSLTPQVRYEGDFLSDKDGWMRIAGSFIAEGGENYISIGNFDGYANSDTLNLHEGGVLDASGAYNIGYWEVANYFIDDVSVVEDTSYHVGTESQLSMGNGQLSIHPNPAAEAIIIETEGGAHLALGLYDIAGRQVFSSSLHSSKQTIGISHLPAGVYVAVLREKGVAVARRKLVKH
ncbi:MAG: T9SS type A sorting domain-containing protein [Flavobacteriales bacterium]|nr:T9SS type A sorting domain-containing protein [Flavobacteriales bacterium]